MRGDVVVTFIPHLIPMTRGILATAYADLTADVTDEQVRGCIPTSTQTSPSCR